MSYDPKTGGPCAVADIRRGALDDIAEVLRGYVARKKREEEAGRVSASDCAFLKGNHNSIDFKGV
jgi:hypothetical protein